MAVRGGAAERNDSLGEDVRARESCGCAAARMCRRLEADLAAAREWNEELERRLAEERSAKRALRAELAELRRENRKLTGQLRRYEAEHTLPSSERVKPKPEAAANEPELPANGKSRIDCGKRKRGGQKGAPGHGRRSYDHLPVQDEDPTLPASRRRCRDCGEPYREFGSPDESEVIEIEVRAYRRRIRRRRYIPACRCGATPRILTAPGAPKVIPKGLLGISVWVFVLLDKFLFQRPTYRMLDALRAYGLDLSQATITRGLKQLAPLFEPIREGLRLKNLEEDFWHVDETGRRVFVEAEGKDPGDDRWWLWLFRSRSTAFYVMAPCRGAVVVNEHFGPDAHGTLMVDRYVVYKSVANDGSGRFVLVFCWMHVRRDFLDLANSYPEHQEWTDPWVDTIRELYRLRDSWREAKSLASRRHAEHELRTLCATMAEIRDAELADGRLREEQARILDSLRNHWDGLTLFLDHPGIPLDHGEAERLFRNAAVGRKNYYGSGSLWSGRLTATLFSIFQTLRLWGLSPRHWLTKYLEACAGHGGRAPPDAQRFLPWNMTAEERRALEQPDGRS